MGWYHNKMQLILAITLLAVSLSPQLATCQGEDAILEDVLSPLPTVVGPPSPAHPSASDIVSFTKRIYSALGNKKPIDLADDFKGEYATLNSDGLLGEKLGTLQEMRLIDLQLSVRHARKMRDLLDILDASDPSLNRDAEGQDEAAGYITTPPPATVNSADIKTRGV